MDHPTECLLFKVVCRAILFWEFGACIVNIFYLKWSFPLQDISNRTYSNILCLPANESPDSPILCAKLNKTSVFWSLPKGISNRRYSNTLFLPTPASADSLILRAKLGFLEAFPKAFRIEDIQICYSCPPLKAQIFRFPKGISNRQKIFTYIIPAHPCQSRFANCMCKTWCFHALPKSFQIEDILIMLFLPTTESSDPPIFHAKLGVSMPFQIEYILIMLFLHAP